MNRNSAIITLAALVALTGATASADVIFDNGAPDLVTAFQSDVDAGIIFADNFVLQEGQSVITDIHWWGVYAGGNTPPEMDDFHILIFDDAGGLPGALFFALAIGDVGRTDTLDDIVGFDAYQFWVHIDPVALSPETTYWLSIVNDTTGDEDDNWFWATSDVETGDGVAVSPLLAGEDLEWGDFPDVDFAFNLTNDDLGVVPEPATMTLLGLGLAGLAYRRRRKA